MGFFKGLFNFVIMLMLSICLLLWFSYGLMSDSILSLDANQELMETTSFTSEVTNELLDRYHMNMSDLRFDEQVLLKFVNESGNGVLGYVFMEYDEMPDVDVTFLKEYVVEQVALEAQSQMDGNIDISAMVTVLREIPEGNSITSGILNYTKAQGFDINKNEIEKVSNVYIENRELPDDELVKKILEAVAVERLDLNAMNTQLSLQGLFDKLMEKNPFTLLRNVYEVMDKDFAGYLPVTILVLILILVVVEFRVGTASVWIMLSLLVAILPLQLLRLANFFIQQEYLDIMGGVESYKNFMMARMIDKLNVYSIIVGIIIVVLFVLSKVFRKQIDKRIEDVEEKRHSRFVLVRLGVFAVLCLGLYLNLNAAKNFNMNLYDELSSLNPDHFEPQSIDLVLRDQLNIDFDF